MAKPTIILATDNGIGMGHLARATAIAEELRQIADPIIVSCSSAVAEITEATGIRSEYIPGKARGWMKKSRWDRYFQDRLLALAEETGASLIAFDGVTPYPGFIATKNSHPHIHTVWIRRGLWRRNRLRFALPLQSAVIDCVIEPGDFAAAYDQGPTAARRDAVHMPPVSLYRRESALDREAARALLGLDINKPAVLVQLGTGDADMNEKMRAALKGLMGWEDLQIVLTKNPVSQSGESLVPEGMQVSIHRHFPLAQVLQAFDGAITATGYNSVHELLPAHIPTVFVSNIRGTDDQDLRAQWCADFGYALRADHDNLANITETVARLQNAELRSSLRKKCQELPAASGAIEISHLLVELATKPAGDTWRRNSLRVFITQALHASIVIYRTLRPYKKGRNVTSKPIFTDATNADFLRAEFAEKVRVEHLISGASMQYKSRRTDIAERAYR